jgi:hypothetical protein
MQIPVDGNAHEEEIYSGNAYMSNGFRFIYA